MRTITICLFMVLGPTAHSIAGWLAVDWQGREPIFEPGSLFWHTGEFSASPVLFRTVLTIPDKPLDFAAVRIQSRRYAYLFITRFDRFSELDPFGRSIAKAEAPAGQPDSIVTLFADLTPHLIVDAGLNTPDKVALLVSTPAEGFRFEAVVVFRDGTAQFLANDPNHWRAQKFPPLTVLESEPCMRPDFDDRSWFPVRVIGGDNTTSPNQLASELYAFVQQERQERLKRKMDELRWRLSLLRDKGIVIVDDEAKGFGGAGRLPEWVRRASDELLRGMEAAKGEMLSVAVEALSLFVWTNDEMTNLANHVILWRALQQPERSRQCEEKAREFAPLLQKAEMTLRQALLHSGASEGTPPELQMAWGSLRTLRRKMLALRHPDKGKALVINDLNGGQENKFGWFDTTALLDNDITRWGLRIETPATVFASPLSPAALFTVQGTEFTLSGWGELKPLRVYRKPQNTGPVCLWAVIGKRVRSLRPQTDGIVYDRSIHGELSENWLLLVHDLARGGGLPIQIVCLQHPSKVVFHIGEKGTEAVTLLFDTPGAQVFVLKPLKEWRGLLRMAQELLEEQEFTPYLAQFRLWSRALLRYPIGFSEAFIHDPKDPNALIIANVYNYWEFRDAWNTEPLKLAPLPPLASYGLLRDYPGLQVLGDAKTLGSWGVWGDHIAVVEGDLIVYRVPVHPIKRFGGFTAFCFGPTDIGVPGNLTELDLIKRTGANSFRPQHNRADEAAMQLVRWCAERGLQHLFNVDEKWVPDVVAHYRRLAELCKDLPPDAVGYDLLNEPETREPRDYNALLRRITRAIREFDKIHPIYVEVIAPWGPGAQPYPESAFANLEPTGDPLTVYSFHDYEVRLMPRYPNEQVDIRSLLARWLPAFKFSIDHRAPIHLGEFGAFEQTEEDIYANRCAITLLLDYFRIFDRFGWHFHYYSNRGIVRVRRDGSIEESLVQEAFRRYFALGRSL
jgi:hypothetical protein